MKVKIEIDTITFVRFWLVVIGFGLAGLLIWNARTALVIIGAAAFLALALNGPVSWLANKQPNPQYSYRFYRYCSNTSGNSVFGSAANSSANN